MGNKTRFGNFVAKTKKHGKYAVQFKQFLKTQKKTDEVDNKNLAKNYFVAASKKVVLISEQLLSKDVCTKKFIKLVQAKHF